MKSKTKWSIVWITDLRVLLIRAFSTCFIFWGLLTSCIGDHRESPLIEKCDVEKLEKELIAVKTNLRCLDRIRKSGDVILAFRIDENGKAFNLRSNHASRKRPRNVYCAKRILRQHRFKEQRRCFGDTTFGFLKEASDFTKSVQVLRQKAATGRTGEFREDFEKLYQAEKRNFGVEEIDVLIAFVVGDQPADLSLDLLELMDRIVRYEQSLTEEELNAQGVAQKDLENFYVLYSRALLDALGGMTELDKETLQGRAETTSSDRQECQKSPAQPCNEV